MRAKSLNRASKAVRVIAIRAKDKRNRIVAQSFDPIIRGCKIVSIIADTKLRIFIAWNCIEIVILKLIFFEILYLFFSRLANLQMKTSLL